MSTGRLFHKVGAARVYGIHSSYTCARRRLSVDWNISQVQIGGHGVPWSTNSRTDMWCWWRGTVVERRSSAGELSLSCARPAADG